MNKAITLADGSKLNWLSKNYSTFLNKSIVLYGSTGTGKSYIIIDILYILRNIVPTPFIITKSRTSAEKNYLGRVPRGCVKWNLNKEWLETFIIRQTETTQIYNMVNNLQNLRSVFMLINNPQAKAFEEELNRRAYNTILTVESDKKASFANKKICIEKIKQDKNDLLKSLYKKYIRTYKDELLKMPDLNKEHKIIIDYLDFIPHSILVFDDCAFMIKKWMKESPSIKELFYQGRHINTTIILGTQADKELDTEIRKNANISMFMTSQDVAGNFNKSSNCLSERDRKRAILCSHTLFENGDEDFKKLVYIRADHNNPFRYTIADVFDQDAFKFGSNKIWELNEYIFPNDDTKIDKDNIYAKYCKY